MTASSNETGLPENVFRGARTGTAWSLLGPVGRFAATWENPPRGRYLIFFSRVGAAGKGGDAWGNAFLSVNEGKPVPIRGMSGTMVAVVDLGRVVPIQSAVVVMEGGNWNPGLAGIEIHETKLDTRTGP